MGISRLSDEKHLLKQILQWHHMLTSAGYPPNTVLNLELNTLADGFSTRRQAMRRFWCGAVGG